MRAGYLQHGLTRALRWTISSPVKVSGAAKIGPLKNLIWTSLAELSPGLRPISANLSRVFFFKLPQSRHPERSASQMDRVTQRLWRGVEEPVLSVAEGTPAVLIFTMRPGAFQPPKFFAPFRMTHL